MKRTRSHLKQKQKAFATSVKMFYSTSKQSNPARFSNILLTHLTCRAFNPKPIDTLDTLPRGPSRPLRDCTSTRSSPTLGPLARNFPLISGTLKSCGESHLTQPTNL